MPQDQEERDQRQQGGGDGQAAHQAIDHPPPAIETWIECVHARASPTGPRLMRQISRRASALSNNVISNNTKAARIRALACRSLLGLGSWVAISEAALCAGLTRRAICMLLPITIVTAIVSPSARPRPSMTPPIMPARAYGTIASQITSHWVPPTASNASRWWTGTLLRTSREMAAMVGRIMIAR